MSFEHFPITWAKIYWLKSGTCKHCNWMHNKWHAHKMMNFRLQTESSIPSNCSSNLYQWSDSSCPLRPNKSTNPTLVQVRSTRLQAVVHGGLALKVDWKTGPLTDWLTDRLTDWLACQNAKTKLLDKLSTMTTKTLMTLTTKCMELFTYTPVHLKKYIIK